MENKSKDFFESTSINFVNKTSDNFFLSEDNLDFSFNYHKLGRTRRLNDYDYNLLREDAYKDINDELLKLEYKISLTEKEIQNISLQIQTANEISAIEVVKNLEEQKRLAEQDYKELIKIYNNKSVSARVTDNISNVFGKKFLNIYNNFRCNIQQFKKIILSKFPNKISYLLEMKNSLNKLENINKSVDDLMSMKTPYGENTNKYEQLSKYIIKANEIQNKLSNNIK